MRRDRPSASPASRLTALTWLRRIYHGRVDPLHGVAPNWCCAQAPNGMPLVRGHRPPTRAPRPALAAQLSPTSRPDDPVPRMRWHGSGSTALLDDAQSGSTHRRVRRGRTVPRCRAGSRSSGRPIGGWTGTRGDRPAFACRCGRRRRMTKPRSGRASRSCCNGDPRSCVAWRGSVAVTDGLTNTTNRGSGRRRGAVFRESGGVPHASRQGR